MAKIKVGDILEQCDGSQLRVLDENDGWFTLENIKEGSTSVGFTDDKLGVKTYYSEHSLDLQINSGMITNIISKENEHG